MESRLCDSTEKLKFTKFLIGRRPLTLSFLSLFYAVLKKTPFPDTALLKIGE